MKSYFAQIALLLLLIGCNGKSEVLEKKEGETHDPKIVELSGEMLKNIDLETEVAAIGNLGMTLKVPGRLTTNVNKTARITSTLEGRLVKFNVDLGAKVKKDDVLALMESPELLGKLLEIKSPITGTVINRTATTGELVEKTKEILTVSDTSELWLIAEVKERDVGALKVGQNVTFEVLSYPNRKFVGVVVLVGNQIEEDSRTLEARIAVSNSLGDLKPGMFADVSITTTVLENALLISDSALQTDEENQVVFVALDDRRFEKRVVKLGSEEDGRVQIMNGVTAGEKVVTHGSFVLKSEMLKGELGEE